MSRTISQSKMNTHRFDESYGGNYQHWKNRSSGGKYTSQPVAKITKDVPLRPEDFPALGKAKTAPKKSAWETPDFSLADRVKEAMYKEDEMMMKTKVKQEEEQIAMNLPLSMLLRKKAEKQKIQNQMKKRIMDEEDDNYRWQVSGDTNSFRINDVPEDSASERSFEEDQEEENDYNHDE